MGLQSLPVAFGVDTAKYICVASIDVTQLGVAAYLALGLHQNTYAAILLGLILPQIFFQLKYFLPDPIANDVKYQVGARSSGGRALRALQAPGTQRRAQLSAMCAYTPVPACLPCRRLLSHSWCLGC